MSVLFDLQSQELVSSVVSNPLSSKQKYENNNKQTFAEERFKNYDLLLQKKKRKESIKILGIRLNDIKNTFQNRTDEDLQNKKDTICNKLCKLSVLLAKFRQLELQCLPIATDMNPIQNPLEEDKQQYIKLSTSLELIKQIAYDVTAIQKCLSNLTKSNFPFPHIANIKQNLKVMAGTINEMRASNKQDWQNYLLNLRQLTRDSEYKISVLWTESEERFNQCLKSMILKEIPVQFVAFAKIIINKVMNNQSIDIFNILGVNKQDQITFGERDRGEDTGLGWQSAIQIDI